MYGKSDFELPCTGDWVLFQPFDEHKGIIVDMLPRERTLYRKKNGTVSDKQAIASYVDKAFIVQSLDDNFNVRRAERFMVQAMIWMIRHHLLKPVWGGLPSLLKVRTLSIARCLKSRKRKVLSVSWSVLKWWSVEFPVMDMNCSIQRVKLSE